MHAKDEARTEGSPEIVVVGADLVGAVAAVYLAPGSVRSRSWRSERTRGVVPAARDGPSR